MRRCQDLPGQVLFQYLDDDDSPRPLRSTDVNDYLRAATGLDATAENVSDVVGDVDCGHRPGHVATTDVAP